MLFNVVNIPVLHKIEDDETVERYYVGDPIYITTESMTDVITGIIIKIEDSQMFVKRILWPFDEIPINYNQIDSIRKGKIKNEYEK